MSAPTGRRQLFGAGGALLVLGAAPAGPGKAAELDGELMEVAAGIAAIDRQFATWNKASASVSNAEWQEELAAYWELADRVAGLPARTPEGLQAKARVLRSVYDSLAGHQDDRISEHVHSLVRDMLGEDVPA